MVQGPASRSDSRNEVWGNMFGIKKDQKITDEKVSQVIQAYNPDELFYILTTVGLAIRYWYLYMKRSAYKVQGVSITPESCVTISSIIRKIFLREGLHYKTNHSTIFLRKVIFAEITFITPITRKFHETFRSDWYHRHPVQCSNWPMEKHRRQKPSSKDQFLQYFVSDS